jgi:hypothetical protein
MAEPPLWSDTELVRYLGVAEALFARHTHILVDDSSTFTEFSTVIGQSLYALDKRIVFIAELGLVVDDGVNDPTYTPLRDRTRGQLRSSYNTGRPYEYTAQVTKGSLRLYPTPDAVYDITMEVARKPLRVMSLPSDTSELDEEYQLCLCDYAAWQALTNNDPEGSNTVAAQVFKDKWDTVLRDVKRDMSKQRAGAYPRARGNWTGKIGGRYF